MGRIVNTSCVPVSTPRLPLGRRAVYQRAACVLSNIGSGDARRARPDRNQRLIRLLAGIGCGYWRRRLVGLGTGALSLHPQSRGAGRSLGASAEDCAGEALAACGSRIVNSSCGPVTMPVHFCPPFSCPVNAPGTDKHDDFADIRITPQSLPVGFYFFKSSRRGQFPCGDTTSIRHVVTR